MQRRVHYDRRRERQAGNARRCLSCLSSINSLLSLQFAAFADKILENPGLAQDERFATNKARVANRSILVPIIENKMREHGREYWLAKFQGLGIPFGPINNIAQTFAHPQAVARGVVQEVEVRAASGRRAGADNAVGSIHEPEPSSSSGPLWRTTGRRCRYRGRRRGSRSTLTRSDRPFLIFP